MKEKNILVVEDDLHMRIFITTVLETSGYNATASKDGQEGIRKVKEDRPDLIILDVMMPRKAESPCTASSRQITSLKIFQW